MFILVVRQLYLFTSETTSSILHGVQEILQHYNSSFATATGRYIQPSPTYILYLENTLYSILDHTCQVTSIHTIHINPDERKYQSLPPSNM